MLFIMTLIIRPSPERSRGINSNYENVYHETGTITLQNGAALTVGTSLAMTEVTVEGAGGFKKTNRIIYGDDGDPGVNTVLSEFTEVP
ncbi:MAG: hypothetical protein LBP20_03545 [Treponema sp.]|nr:hypothetical protein [Treponema sp.]